jgi:uncharacterized protein
MVAIIENKKAPLIELCRKFSVKRLEVFGSAASGNFDLSKSDIDFLVEFETSSPGEHAARYFGFLAALQDLFSSNIDLVEVQAIANPYFKKDIDLTRVTIYG